MSSRNVRDSMLLLVCGIQERAEENELMSIEPICDSKGHFYNK